MKVRPEDIAIGRHSINEKNSFFLLCGNEDTFIDKINELIINELKLLGHNNTHYLNDLDNLNQLLDAIIKPGDMVITMGAGNIWRYSDKYNEHLKSVDLT